MSTIFVILFIFSTNVFSKLLASGNQPKRSTTENASGTNRSCLHLFTETDSKMYDNLAANNPGPMSELEYQQGFLNFQTNSGRRIYNGYVIGNSLKFDSIMRQHTGNPIQDFHFKDANDVMSMLMQSGMKNMRFHTFFWHLMYNYVGSNYYQNLVNQLDSYSSQQVRDLMQYTIQYVMRYVLTRRFATNSGTLSSVNVTEWDIVNEPITDQQPFNLRGHSLSGQPHSPQLNTISGGLNNYSYWARATTPQMNYIEYAYRLARSVNPNLKLFLNEYVPELQTFDGIPYTQPGVWAENKTEALYFLAHDLAQKGLLDGVGIQYHVNVHPPHVRQQMFGAFTRIAGMFEQIGLKISITELDARISENYYQQNPSLQFQAQADTFRGLLERCVQASNCDTFVTWGYHDQVSWIAQFFPGYDRGLLFNGPFNYITGLFNPKPAALSIKDYIENEMPIPVCGR